LRNQPAPKREFYIGLRVRSTQMAQETKFIKCPECSHEFSPTDQISKDVERILRKEFEEKEEKRTRELQSKLNELQKEKLAIEQQKATLEEQAKLAVLKEKASLENSLRLQIKKENELTLSDLKSALAAKDKSLAEAQHNELELRKKTRELEEREKQFELEVQRKMDGERATVELEAKKRAAEEYQLKMNEKDLKLAMLTKTIEDLERKANQGSQQLQGEALEHEIEKNLKARFPTDQISEVKKGKRGADVMQIVMNRNGEEAGALLFEAKNVKNWSNEWIAKAKEDQREARASAVVIVTEVLPQGISRFDLVDGVWVSDFASFPFLVTALRMQVIELHHARIASLGKGEKMDLLYQYMTESQFKQRVEAIVESFRSMREALEREKAAMNKAWAQRERSLDQVIVNTAGMYGDVQAIIGSQLPQIETLELPEPE